MSKLVNICTLEGHSDRVWDIAWTPGGKLFATCSGDKTIRIWGQDAQGKWTCKAILDDAHQRTIRSLAWSPDGKHLAAASFDATTSVWVKKEVEGDLEFDCLATLEGHENEVKSVSWDSSGSLLATCSRDKSVWIWEMESDNEFECVSVLHGHSQDVKKVRWHPEKEILFSCSYDDTIKVWQDDEDDWYCTQTLSGHTSTVWDFDFNARGDRLASCSDDLNVIIWNTKSIQDGPKKLCTLTGYHKRTIFGISWSKNDLIATGSADDNIRVFMQDPRVVSIDAPSYVLIATAEKAHTADINCVRWNPAQPDLLASCGDDHVIRLWEIKDLDQAIL